MKRGIVTAIVLTSLLFGGAEVVYSQYSPSVPTPPAKKKTPPAKKKTPPVKKQAPTAKKKTPPAKKPTPKPVKKETRLEALTRKANAGDAVASNDLGYCYEKGIGCGPSPKNAFNRYKESANRGNGLGFYNLGVCYDRGFGCAADYNMSYQCFKRASEFRIPQASFNCGNSSAFGWDDLNAALTEYNKAANAGIAEAFNNIGICYIKKGEYHRAFESFTKGANQGVAEAMYNLGVCFEKSYGCDENLSQAFTWYEKAAGAGNPSAMFRLAQYYDSECEISWSKSDYSAFSWYLKAAEGGHVEAMKCLCLCYWNGRGCSIDKATARRWDLEYSSKRMKDNQRKSSVELFKESVRKHYTLYDGMIAVGMIDKTLSLNIKQ